MLTKNITKPIKVAQLSGYVSAETSYHHGETSLQQAIIGMAQNFVGTNNINLLVPDGNHGSRYNGGKDAASPRYIFTYLSKATPHIFNSHDSPLLVYQNDDGISIEPEWYIPIIPMILVNGAEGIGTGFSTYIPPHKPLELIFNLKKLIDGEDMIPMKPYFNGFNSEVEDIGDGCYVTKGKYKRIAPTKIQITEFPIGTWISPYKEFLESLIESNKTDSKKKITLKDVKNHTTDETSDINIIIEFKTESELDSMIQSKILEKELKLVKNFNTNNMYLFNQKSIPTKYNTTFDILKEFYHIRLNYYVLRKKSLIEKLTHELLILESRVRFIMEYIDGILNVNNKPKDFFIEILSSRGYVKVDNTFDYLISMPLYTITSEKIEELKNKRDLKKIELDVIKRKSEKDMWKDDLRDLVKHLL